MQLTAEQVHGFSETFLKKNFDRAAPTPPFHKEMWGLCCDEHPLVGIAAPRGHSKSTAITHSYTLANVCFRVKQYILIISDTERQAKQFLSDIKNELIENQDLKETFEIAYFEKETETDVIVVFSDGYKCRVQAYGSGQPLRGAKWDGKRPDLIVGDDLENDEMVLNGDRREKFRNWFFGALLPCLSDHGTCRIVGTILHLDSLLERLLNDDEWKSKRYAAHNRDFSKILWPERFSKERLQSIRRRYVNQGNPEGYSQEYLNYPIDEVSAYFQKSDFRKIPEESWAEPVVYYAAGDLAISEKARADYTVFVVVGVTPDGRWKVVDLRRGRWNSLEIIEEMFSINQTYKPDLFTIEDGMIQKAIGPVLNTEMRKRGKYINVNPLRPSQDKQTRARSLQARMRQGMVEFDHDAPWFGALQDEMMRFPRDAHDDQVDALAWIGLTLDKIIESPTQEEIDEDEWEEEYIASGLFESGRNPYTGY